MLPPVMYVIVTHHREALDHNVLGLKHAIEVARKMKKLQVRDHMTIDVVMVILL